MERFFVCETLVDLNAGYSLNENAKLRFMYTLLYETKERHLYCTSF